MASSAEQNLKDYKALMGKNNACYLAIKPQYVGSWHDDIQNLANLTGTTPAKLMKENPWLTDNNYPANNHDYTIIKIKKGGKKGTSSDSLNTPSTGYYVGDGWIFPLGVGTWYCSTGYSAEHRALDFTTGVAGRIEGMPIYATKAGTVVQCYTSSTYGNTLLIRHDETKDETGNCYYSRYAHLFSLPAFKSGDKVSAGDKIANVGGRPGTTGAGTSTGAHLHFGLYWTSATRTDYTAFTAKAEFAVDPNSIEGFPGTPWVENQRNEVKYTKSEYITEDEMKKVQEAGRKVSAPTTPEAEKVQLIADTNAIAENIANRLCKGKNITDADHKKLIHDFIKGQIETIRNNGASYAQELFATGDAWAVFDRMCRDVVNNAKWYMEQKVTESITQATDSVKAEAKKGLKNWVFNSTGIDPNTKWGKNIGDTLDSYFDTCVNTTWGAVQTAITTGDIELALQTWITTTKNTSIDYMADVTLNGISTSIEAYVPRLFHTGDMKKDEVLGRAAADLAIGFTNTVITSVAGWLKGDISLEQMAVNIGSAMVMGIAKFAINYYIVPLVTEYVSSWITSAITLACTQLGITLGDAVPVIGNIVGGIIGYIVGLILGQLVNKLVGMFQQT